MAGLVVNPEEGRPRAAWRLLGQSLLFAVLLLVLSPLVWLAGPLPEAGDPAALLPADVLTVALGFIVTAAAAVASLALAARWLDRRPLRDFGLRIDAAWWRDCAFGLLLGVALMSGVFAVQVAAGWLVVEEVALDAAALARFASAGVLPFIAVGIYEELLSTGYHLSNVAQGLRGALGARGAIAAGWLVSSLLFGILHAVNPAATILSTLIIMAAGLFLALGYVLTGRLGLPIGLHTTWNLTMGPVFGMPVSGVPFGGTALVRTTAVGPEALTGGAFGPEGGVVGAAAIGLGVLAILWWVRRADGRLAFHEAIAAPPAATAGPTG